MFARVREGLLLPQSEPPAFRHGEVQMNVPISQDMSRDWLNSKNYKAFVICMLREILGKTGHDPKTCPPLEIVTGLPVGYMGTADKEKCEQVIRGAAAKLGLKVAEVDIVPQPIGTFLDVISDADGNVVISDSLAGLQRIAIADIGYNTTDIAVVEDFINYIEADSGSIPVGAHNCFELLADALKAKYSLDHVGIRTAEQVAREKVYLLKSKPHDEAATLNHPLPLGMGWFRSFKNLRCRSPKRACLSQSRYPQEGTDGLRWYTVSVGGGRLK